MIKKIRPPHRTPFLTLGVVVSLIGPTVRAQTSYTSPYPDPTAAAGMTSGMPNGMTNQQIEMMRVRTEAQSAQGDAVAASMARSVDQTIEAQNRQRTLQDAREIKAIKRGMLDRMKWERANSTQVNKVTSDDMSAWNTSNGNVRVEREVPDPFIASLVEEERRAMERGEREKPKRGFTPFKSTAAALTSPFQRNTSYEEEYTTAAAAINSAPQQLEEESGGFFSKLKVPKFGGRYEPIDIPNPATAEPQFVGNSSSATAPVSAVGSSSTGQVVPAVSGASLVREDAVAAPGNSPQETAEQAAAPAPVIVGSNVRDVTPEKPEKTGFFSRFKSDSETPVSSSGGGGFLGFGKKKSPEPVGVDASLFPTGAVSQAPTGGSLGGGYTAEDVAQDSQMVPSSTGQIALPGEEPNKKRFGLSIPKPSLSIPSIGSGGGSSGASVPTLTTTNSFGNDYYVVTNAAQFMVYGDDQLQSEVRALPAGTVVRMTKPGDQWASIQLPNGSAGIVQNKFLRGASGSEAGGTFAQSN